MLASAPRGTKGMLVTNGRLTSVARKFLDNASQLERKLKAQGLALFLHTEMVDLSGRNQAAIASVDLKRAAVLPPPSLVEHAADLYLLSPAGGNLLQMASALNANARQVSELQEIGLVERELWSGIAANLGLTPSKRTFRNRGRQSLTQSP